MMNASKDTSTRKSFSLPILLVSGLLIGVVLALSIIRGDFGGDDRDVSKSRWSSDIGSQVPDIELVDLEGRGVRLSDYLGTPMVINFWGTWCPPCREEMPLLQAFYERYSPDLVVVGINVDDSQEQVQRFVQESQVSFPILLDGNGAAAEAFAVRAFPTTFFVDAEGKLQAQHIGLLFDDILKGYLLEVEVGL